jgi:diguanylate cyclase (GGDEF)-like protein/PAS domain S-box-containing protein
MFMDYSAFENLPVVLLVIDENYKVVYANKKAKELYGMEFYPYTVKIMKEQGLESYQTVYAHTTKEGRENYIYVIASYNREKNTYIEIHIELSQMLKAFEYVKLSPELLLTRGPMVFFFLEHLTGWPVKLVSPNVKNLTGYTAEELVERKLKYADLIHKEDLDSVAKEVKKCIESSLWEQTHKDYRIITKDGKVKWVLDHTVCLRDDEGKVIGYYKYVVDITEKHEEEELFHSLAFASPVGIFLRQGKRLIYANKALSEITGYSIEELLALEDVLSLIHPKDRGKVKKVMLKRDMGIKGVERYQVRIKRKDGKVVWVQISSEAVHYKSVPAGVGVVMDITDRKLTENMLKRLALYDRLTGIYNRYALEEFLKKEVAKAYRYKTPLSLLFIDVDNFKQINDAYGHQAGDRVLKQLARLFKNNIRKADILGRWGGEEFLLIMRSETSPATVAEKLRKIVEGSLFDGKIKITVSVGITAYREGDSMDTILRRVDTALYKAKSEGKNRVFYL